MIIREEHWIELIGKYLSGNTSEEERLALIQWLEDSEEHRQLYDRYELIWSSAHEPAISTPEKEQYWAAIEDAINQPGTRVMTPRILWRVAAAAAVVLIAVFAWQLVEGTMFSTTDTMVEMSASDETEYLALPDGSKVWLRANSQLSYDKRFSDRIVKLRGEGYFEIAHDPDRPFSVEAGNATARVLGTKFNLRELPDGEVELYVTEGTVAFSRTGVPEQNVIVTREQIAVSRLKSLKPQRIDKLPGDVNRLSWKTSRLIFDHVPLEQVLQDIERHFGISFKVEDPGLMQCEIKADFARETLRSILDTIEFSLNCKIESSGGRYHISGEPCNTSAK